MNERTKTGIEILQTAGLIGLLGNILLRETPWGLNAFLFVTAFVAGLLMLLYRRRPELLTKNTLALSGAMIFFASMYLIRDAEELLVADTFAIIAIMGVITLVNFGIKPNVAGAFHYGAGVVWSGISSVFGPIALFVGDVDWQSMPGNRLSKTVFSVLRGVAIAMPLLLIFGGLFMAADAAFEGLVNETFNFEADEVASHVVLTAVLAWLTAGYFRGALSRTIIPAPDSLGNATAKSDDSNTSFVDKVAAEPGEESGALPDNATILEHINRSDPPNADTPAASKKTDWRNFDNSILPPVFTLGTVETVIVLGLIDLLFLTFVVMQVPYLFGGMDLVQNTPDFKLADYARRGFGELVAVAALVLPMLLASHWLLRRDSKVPERLFKILAGVQIALLFVIMASAVQRLLLLTGEFGYGLTTVRFYPMVFMIWLAVVFGWFALTVFRGHRKHFAWGALWSAIAILGITNLMNPHAFIVRTNLNLMKQGREFDVSYNRSLSHDAISALVEGVPYMTTADQCQVGVALADKLAEVTESGDLRSWSIPRSFTREAVANVIPMEIREVPVSRCRLLDSVDMESVH